MFVYLGLGSNLGDRVANLRQAIQRLAAIVTIQRQSSVYETAPLHVTDQPYFLNMAVMGETNLSPNNLLHAVKTIEAEMGRDLSPNAQRFGPRPIDIDIVLASHVADPDAPDDYIIVDTPDLTIPHPRMPERAFVLNPLVEIASGGLSHPLLSMPINTLLNKVEDQRCTKLGTLDDIERKRP
jgi:2-amino-4-hydroxy-6-hydroxymethyldihydropteridine diphosphokinase